MPIPIIIPCYNNYKYVKNMIEQIERINPYYKQFIYIMDNASTDIATIDWLNHYEGTILWNTTNNGPWIDATHNSHVFQAMPEYFIITDPDLQLNENTPRDFIEQMLQLCIALDCDRIGLALDISDSHLFLQGNYGKEERKSSNIPGTPTIGDTWNLIPNRYLLNSQECFDVLVSLSIQLGRLNSEGHTLEDIMDLVNYNYSNTYVKTIEELERNHWNMQYTACLNTINYTLYKVSIDTTFHIRCKTSKPNGAQYRIAGDFTCKHLPWYKSIRLFSLFERYQNSKHQSAISTISNPFVYNIEKDYIFVNKNKETIMIENTAEDKNLDFWKNTFPTWEEETFKVFDFYLDKEKIFIDIGGWIGTTCLYASRNSKHVYVVEADRESFKSLEKNIDVNSRNITAIHKAIYNKDNEYISFGANQFFETSNLNESTSQIQKLEDTSNPNSYKIQTITVSTLLKQYLNDSDKISLIKVDIEGGEENILEELLELRYSRTIPMYISFHHSWWSNKDLSRFSKLSDIHKLKIQQNPFVSILF